LNGSRNPRTPTVPGGRWMAVVSLACALAFVALALAQGPTANEDTALLRQIVAWRSPWLTWVMQGASWLGSGGAEFPFAFAVAGYFAWHRDRRQAIGYLGWSLGGWAMYGLLKELFHRARPKVVTHLSGGGWYSFPSGHAMLGPIIYVFAAYLLLAKTDRPSTRWLIFLAAWALVLLIAISRVYLGVHYPSDVIGGLLAGSAWLGLSLVMMRRQAPTIGSPS
jgi:undecaprenyl-diphosphatase